ncbi:MAG: redox-sensing transcriptional repressor Rex [Candidatus Cryosericum sp.]|nr:redox-sensing transcriptional repressor Rex [bacterium]
MKTTYGKKYISMATVSRMATYLQCLTYLEHQHTSTVSSHELAALLGVTPEQVRQDFSTFGLVGKRGSGYDVVRLKTEIELIFGRGVDRWKCCIVGAGSLGTALVSSHMVQKWGFKYAAAFDTDPRKIGTHIGRIPVYAVEDLKDVIRREHIAIGVMTVPASSARKVADLLCEAGIRGILNFAPRVIKVPASIPVLSVDLSQEFLKLAFYIQSAEQRAREQQAQIEATSHGE